MQFRNIAFWTGFFIIGLLGQRFLPGIDLLVVGLIIAMQERNPIQIGWVFLISMLLQEGQGTLDFGAAFCWYGLTMFLYYTGRSFFETENIFFVLLVCAGLGVLHFGLIYSLAGLQGISVSTEQLAWESLAEALIVPLAWLLVHVVRQRIVPHAD